MRRLVLLAALLPLTLAQSCSGRKFEVVMEQTPDGQARRELTVWTADSQSVRQPEADLLAQAEKAYGKAGEAVGQKLRFSGTFDHTLPPDLVHEGLTNHAFVVSKTAQVGNVFLCSEHAGPGPTGRAGPQRYQARRHASQRPGGGGSPVPGPQGGPGEARPPHPVSQERIA